MCFISFNFLSRNTVAFFQINFDFAIEINFVFLHCLESDKFTLVTKFTLTILNYTLSKLWEQKPLPTCVLKQLCFATELQLRQATAAFPFSSLNPSAASSTCIQAKREHYCWTNTVVSVTNQVAHASTFIRFAYYTFPCACANPTLSLSLPQCICRTAHYKSLLYTYMGRYMWVLLLFLRIARPPGRIVCKWGWFYGIFFGVI